MKANDEISVEIDQGKVLEIRCLAISETNNEGNVKVFFELNGQPRTVVVQDQNATSVVAKREKADASNAKHIGAPMPGVIASIAVKAGDSVEKGDLLLTLEAMKMETSVQADQDGTIAKIAVSLGDQIDVKDLLIELS